LNAIDYRGKATHIYKKVIDKFICICYTVSSGDIFKSGTEMPTRYPATRA